MWVTGDGDYTVTYTYDKNNRLLRDVKAVGDVVEKTSYQYDPNGNQLAREKETISPAGTAGESLMGFNVGGSCVELREYNGFGQLASVYIDGIVASYRYKPDGLRYEKTVDDVAETHLWDGSNMVAELDGESSLKAKYIRGVHLIAREADSQRSYYLFNAHGDVVQTLVEGTGNLWYYDYDAFGVERDMEGQDREQDANPFRYCGEYLDKETGDIYLRGRFYNPAIGRMLSEDPVRAKLNWYIYCGNNPILYVDPSGLDYYIIYDPYIHDDKHGDLTGKANAERMKAALEKEYNKPVHLMAVSDESEFTGAWKEMKGSIDGVIINLHGSEGSMSFRKPKSTDGSFVTGDKGKITQDEVIELARDPDAQKKFTGPVVLVSCNTGYGNNSIAKTFLSSFKELNTVIAPSGYSSEVGSTLSASKRGTYFLDETKVKKDAKGYLTMKKDKQGKITAKERGGYGFIFDNIVHLIKFPDRPTPENKVNTGFKPKY